MPCLYTSNSNCVGGSGTTFLSMLYTSHLLKELSWVCRWENLTFAVQNHPGVWTASSPIPGCLMKFGSQHRLAGLESDASSMSFALKQMHDRQVQKKTQTPWSRHGKFSLASLSLCPHTFPPLPSLFLYVRLVTIPGVNSI